jgi:hypothetical protein
MRQRVLQFAEERSKVLDAQVAELLGKGRPTMVRFSSRVASAGGRLGTVGDDPPAAVRRARQVGRVEVQVGVAGWLDALAWPEEVVVAVDQRRRQRAVLEQFLFAVEVAKNGVEQAGTLLDRARRPVATRRRRQNQRQRVEFPGPVGAFGSA